MNRGGWGDEFMGEELPPIVPSTKRNNPVIAP